MIKLSEDHIASVYWLAEAYLSTNQRLINKVANPNVTDGFLRFLNIRNKITRIVTEECVLCESAPNVPNMVSKCQGCIHALRNDSNRSCVSDTAALCLIKPDNTKRYKAGDKLFIKKMHARGMYLYSLLDLYYKQLEQEDNDATRPEQIQG